MNKGFRKDTRCPLCLVGENHTRLEHRREMRVWWGKDKSRPTQHAPDAPKRGAKKTSSKSKSKSGLARR